MRALLALLLTLLAAVPAMAQSARDYVEEGFRAAQIGMSSSAGKALREIGQRAAAGSDGRAALLRERQAVALRLRQVEEQLVAPDADRIALAGEVESLTNQLALIDDRVATEFPDFAALTAPEPLGLAEVQALLRPDEALILIFVGPQFTDVFAVSPKKVGWHQVGAGTATLADVVATLRQELDPTAPSRSAAALEDEPAPARPAGAGFSRGMAFRLYEVLLQPVEPVFADAAHIFTVTTGPLTSLPLSLFVTSFPEGDDDDPAALRATDWLIRRHALTTLPSVESLAVVRGLPPPPPPLLAFAGYGDPALDGGQTLLSLSRGGGVMRAGVADAEQLRALPPLPQTRGELTRIADTLGKDRSRLVLGADATETAVKTADLSATAVIAFATHGLLSGDLPGLDEPALVMTPPANPDFADDGLLTASEITELKLSADWVILSACNTAGGDAPGAEGLSGLARAFLFAGARSILVSHWPVRDDAAARLTTGTFKALVAGEARGKADALRHAMLELMADPRDPTLAHPSAWAPFVLVGEGG